MKNKGGKSSFTPTKMGQTKGDTTSFEVVLMQVVEVLAKLKKGCTTFPFFKERRGACLEVDGTQKVSDP